MSEFTIVIVGGGISALEAVPFALNQDPEATIAVVTGNTFLEFSMAASIFLLDSTEHPQWVSGDPENWKVKNKNVKYFHTGVESCDCDTRMIVLGQDQGAIKYKTLIVATGSRMPLVTPEVGQSLKDRMDEVKAFDTACSKAKTVVFNGAGLVGVEFCGEFRLKYPNAKIILISRSGTILDSDFGAKAEQPDADMVQKVTDILQNELKVEIKKGSIEDERCLEARYKVPGTIELDTGEKVDYDVYMPTHVQGPNTEFLKSRSPAFLKKGRIRSNECLQSMVHPEVFGVNVTTTKLVGHPVSSRVTAAAKTCVLNALLVANNKTPKPHVDKEKPPPMPHPMNIKIGHGPGGNVIWLDMGLLGYPLCQPCKGGFPFCPPPCCWCLLSGSIKGLGVCGKAAEGEGPAVFIKQGLLPKLAKKHHYLGLGKLGPSAPAQLKMV